MNIDSEIKLIQEIYAILKPLNHSTRERVLEWLQSRFDWEVCADLDLYHEHDRQQSSE